MSGEISNYLVESCFRLSEDVVRNRQNAANKNFSYAYRIACDKMSLNYETMILSRVEIIMRRLENAASFL